MTNRRGSVPHFRARHRLGSVDDAINEVLVMTRAETQFNFQMFGYRLVDDQLFSLANFGRQQFRI